ncbi:MAG: hypothetical protein ABSF68_09790 [Candidatus Acidiferrales bacterium]
MRVPRIFVTYLRKAAKSFVAPASRRLFSVVALKLIRRREYLAPKASFTSPVCLYEIAFGWAADFLPPIRAADTPIAGEIVLHREQAEAPALLRTSNISSRPVPNRIRPPRAYVPSFSAPASRVHEIVNPLFASNRCLRSNPLKKARDALPITTGIVEPSILTSFFVAPF